MSSPPEIEFFKELYRGFSLPLSDIDCGEKCGPYNDYGVPVCCDIKLLVPTVYDLEWLYLQKETNLWRPWQGDWDLKDELQEGQVLVECLGYQDCQRPFRSLTCRAFPFYPYLDSAGIFAGLAYYHEYQEKCWIISNLTAVSQAYKLEFKLAFEKIFQSYPESRQNYYQYSQYMREEAANRGDQIVLLDFMKSVFFVDPETEELQQVDFNDLLSYGPFGIARDLSFPEENQD